MVLPQLYWASMLARPNPSRRYPAFFPDEQRLDVPVEKVFRHVLGYGCLHRGYEVQIAASHLAATLKPTCRSWRRLLL